jgi:hypothetical protein
MTNDTQMKQEMTLQKQVLERIKERNLKPTPKGVFRARDFILWGLLGVFVAALSVGFGMIIFMATGTDYGVLERLGFSTSEKLAYSIPYFWILATLAIAVIAYRSFRQTRSGYKMSTQQIVLFAALIAVALGSTVYALDFTSFVDRAASENIPLYNAVNPLNTNVWLDPENGLLSGTVRSKESDEEFTLRDAESVLWVVKGDDISMPEGFVFHAGDRIKIIGTQTGPDEFRAIEIRPK